MPNNYYNPWSQQQMSPAQQIFVQGEAGANAFQMPMGCNFIILWEADRSIPRFYIKQLDQTGRPLPVESYDYERHIDPPVVKQSDLSNYLTIDQFRDLLGHLSVNGEGRIVLNESGV